MLLNWEKTAFTGVTFGKILYFVDESGSKVKDGAHLLQKLVSSNVTLGAKYEDKVNRNLEKQGDTADFKADKMLGKEYVSYPKPLLQKTSDHSVKYMQMMFEHHTKPQTVYFHKGKQISKDKAVLLGLFKPSYFAPKPTAGRGELTEEQNFYFRTINIQNILRLHVGGKILKLVD